MVDFKRLSTKAKDLVEKRGGTESLKRDADELKNIAKGPGTFKDKAKKAADALKDPGASEDAGARSERTGTPASSAGHGGTRAGAGDPTRRGANEEQGRDPGGGTRSAG